MWSHREKWISYQIKVACKETLCSQLLMLWIKTINTQHNWFSLQPISTTSLCLSVSHGDFGLHANAVTSPGLALHIPNSRSGSTGFPAGPILDGLIRHHDIMHRHQPRYPWGGVIKRRRLLFHLVFIQVTCRTLNDLVLRLGGWRSDSICSLLVRFMLYIFSVCIKVSKALLSYFEWNILYLRSTMRLNHISLQCVT